MQQRVGLARAFATDADILLMDEPFASVDEQIRRTFQEDLLRLLREEGKTVLFVTHDMAAVQRFCHRAMLLERGRIVALGDPEDVADRYLEQNFGEIGEGAGDGLGVRAGDGAARVLDAWIEDEHGERQGAVAQGHQCAIRATIQFERSLDDPVFAVALVNAERQNVFVANSAVQRERSGAFGAGDTVELEVSFENALAPGRYAVSSLISHASGGIVDRWESIFTFVVTGARAGGGLVDLAHDIRLETRAASRA
ncbi:MAG: Wzt carbohydrate-binding domain-containing protein [Pseudonocardiaceae bacterium]